MYHPRFRGDPYEMGVKLGVIFRQAKAQFPISLDSFQQSFGKASLKLLETHFPEAATEIRGVTDTLECDHPEFGAWLMCMGCCLDPQNETSVEVRGCTAFSFVHNGHVVYGRNNDLPPFLKNVSKSIYYQPAHKNRFILNTSSFINGEEGVNECGLVAAMTFVQPLPEEIVPGLNSLFLVRYLLENCTTVPEAVKSLRQLPIASSCNILLADPSGEMAVMECHPTKINERGPEYNSGGGKFVIAVNHFTTPQMQAHDASDQNAFYSAKRYETAYNALKKTPMSNNFAFTRDLLRGKYGFMSQYPRGMGFDTIWSSIFNISEKYIYLAEGNPRRADFKRDRRLF